MWKVFTARYGLIPFIKQITFGFKKPWWKLITARYGLIYKADYVWSLNNSGGKCLQRGTG